MTVTLFFQSKIDLLKDKEKKYLEVLGKDLRQKTSRERSVKTGGLYSVYKLVKNEIAGIFWFQVLKMLASLSYFML